MSTTAINPPLEVASHNQELYQTLDGLKQNAANYVNLSRLQLALRGLETKEAVVRVAVLSIGDQKIARKLTRLLLVDPLAAEGAWEQQLEDTRLDDGRGILLRHGDETDVHPPNPLLQTISLPSRVLHKNNLEVLICTLNVNVAGPGRPTDSDRPKDAILVPSLQTPTSSSGRVTLVTYPVHKAIVIGQGIRSSVAYGRYTADTVEDISPEMVKVAIGLPAPQDEALQDTSDAFIIVDVDTAAKALSKFRESTANSVAYEQGWFRSGMPALTDWLANGVEQSESRVKPAVKNLIASILDDVEANITKEDAQRLEELVASTVSESTRQPILESIKVWAEHGHIELRDQLEGAFAGKNWRKIAWWKLFWRVDDVWMIASEVLERRWLVDAEKECIYLAGHIEQAGLFKEVERYNEDLLRKRPENVDQHTCGTYPPLPHEIVALEKRKAKLVDDGEVKFPEPKPWPAQIPITRALLLSETVPPLQALAQKLVLQTLSTTLLTSVLSALLYVSIYTSLFEAGAVAALGLVFSLKRMQKKWESARGFWKGEIREEGRKALKDTEDKIRFIVQTTGMPKQDVDGAEERRIAKEAIQKARETLESS